MSISEQVKELRTYANASLYARESKAKEVMNQAADTIESLSAKLADMERSAGDCGGGWILSKDRLPAKDECGDYKGDFLVTVYANKLTTLYMEYEHTTIKGKKLADGYGMAG